MLRVSRKDGEGPLVGELKLSSPDLLAQALDAAGELVVQPGRELPPEA